MGALAELIKLGIKTAAKQADEVVPKAVSQIDETADILSSLAKKPRRMEKDEAFDLPQSQSTPGGGTSAIRIKEDSIIPEDIIGTFDISDDIGKTLGPNTDKSFKKLFPNIEHEDIIDSFRKYKAKQLKELGDEPDALYHVTSKKNIPSVLKKGLLKKNESKNMGKALVQKDEAVSVFTNPEDAVKWAQRIAWSKEDKVFPVILKIAKDRKVSQTDISDFQTKYFRGDHKERYRSEDLQKEAMKLDEGLIGLDDFIKARDKIKPLKTYGTVPPLNKQTDEAGNLIAPDVFDPMEIVGPLGKDKVNKSGIIGINKNIKEGERATSRFDIDAYNMYDRYIAAIQTKVKDKFKLKGYSPTAVLKDVKFNYRPNQAFAIAQGKGKSPFATMEGNWKNLTPEEVHKYANKKIGTKEWTEVGFDPAARLSFYNRATGEPVFNAEEVIQVGAMLLARGIKKPTKKQLEKLNIKTKAGEVIRYKEGGSLLPVIKKQDGGDFDFGLSADDMAAAYEEAGIDTSSPSGFMDDTDAGLYSDAYGQPGKHQSPEDANKDLTGTDMRFNPLQSPAMKIATGNPYYFNPNAPKDKEEADRQAKDVQLFENFKHYGVADPWAHMTSAERKNEAILEMLEKKNILEEEYGLTIMPDGEIVRMAADEVAPMFKGGQVLEGLDGEYMRKRNSKEKLEGMIGIQSRQYGGGLDDAYMNRRRSSAFAAPDATSAFDSPMSKNGLPTIYREQGGPLPITSVYGQGIPRIVYREKGGGLSDEDDSYQGAVDYFDDGSNMFDDVGSYMGTQTSEEQAAAQQAAQDINDELADIRSDQQMNYEQYYGKSGDGRPSFTSGTLDPDTGLFTGGEFIYGRPGGPEGPSQQDYINRLNKEGFPSWTYPYYNALKDRGMTNDEATAALAAAMATPGGLSGMQSAYGGYSYGGPLGTMRDLLEKGMASRVNINNLIEEDKDIKAYNKDDDEEFLSQGELVASGLKGVADDVSNLVSLKGNLTPTTMELIDSKFTEAGLNFTPASGAMGTLMNFLVPSVAKGLSNLTGAGRTIGTVTDPKTGQSFNVSDTGKFSLNLPPAEVDYGNDPKTVRKRKPVQKAVASTTEEKPKEGIAGYYERLNRLRPAQSRSESNKYIERLLADLYPTNTPRLG